MYTLDTNAIISYVQDDASAASVLEAIYARNVPVYVSVMTEAELFAFPHLSDADAERIEQFLHTVSVIPMDSQIARLAAIVRKTYGLTMADSVIAATALFTGTCVVTRNTEDFRKVLQLPIEEIEPAAPQRSGGCRYAVLPWLMPALTGGSRTRTRFLSEERRCAPVARRRPQVLALLADA